MTIDGGTPSFLVTGQETHRIEFEDGGWIDIARCVTAMQRARWSNAASTVTTKMVGKGKQAKTETDMSFDNERFLAAFLADIVKGTSAGPIDVSQLSEAAVTRIQEEFNKLNPSLNDEQEGENGLGE